MLVAFLCCLQLTGVDDDLGEEEPLGELDASKHNNCNYIISSIIFFSLQYYYDSVIVMIYVLVYNQPLRKNVINVMFWYRDVTSWDMRWSLWRTRPFKIPSDHGHLLASSIYLPKSSIVLFMPWANCGVFIAGLVIRKNIMGISTFKQSIPSVSTRKSMQFPSLTLTKYPRKKAALHLGPDQCFEILASIEGITLVLFKSLQWWNMSFLCGGVSEWIPSWSWHPEGHGIVGESIQHLHMSHIIKSY